MEIDVEGAERAYGFLQAHLDNIDPNWTDSFRAGLHEDFMRDALDMLDGTYARNLELAAAARAERDWQLDHDIPLGESTGIGMVDLAPPPTAAVPPPDPFPVSSLKGFQYEQYNGTWVEVQAGRWSIEPGGTLVFWNVGTPVYAVVNRMWTRVRESDGT